MDERRQARVSESAGEVCGGRGPCWGALIQPAGRGVLTRTAGRGVLTRTAGRGVLTRTAGRGVLTRPAGRGVLTRPAGRAGMKGAGSLDHPRGRKHRAQKSAASRPIFGIPRWQATSASPQDLDPTRSSRSFAPARHERREAQRAAAGPVRYERDYGSPSPHSEARRNVFRWSSEPGAFRRCWRCLCL